MSSVATGVVIADRWAKNSVARSAALVAGLVGLTAISAQISVPLPFTPVPLTLQTFAVLAGAAALGAERAVVAQISYLLLAVAGAPILAGGTGGSEKVIGATGGYLVGFVVASYLVGRIAERSGTKKVRSTVLAYAIGYSNYLHTWCTLVSSVHWKRFGLGNYKWCNAILNRRLNKGSCCRRSTAERLEVNRQVAKALAS